MPSRKKTPATRNEHDLLGVKAVPADAYYGIQTARALENFHLSGIPIGHYPDFIRALAMVKLATARANHDLKRLPDRIFNAIETACEEIIDGRLHDQFPLDVFQGGAGTSTNMNINEVVANRALELMGRRRGDYEFCNPHDHVNLSQSTNDVYPTALRLATALSNARLLRELQRLVAAFRERGRRFRRILKLGRTQLQDAVPMTLGQEFEAWARSLGDEAVTLRRVEAVLMEINLGGTAIGTGLNAPRGYARKCARHLARIARRPIHLAADLVEATQDTQAFVLYSSVLKSVAIKLSKICNDLRLLSSGPRGGLAEIQLPAVQPGSTIMPGKVNPVIPEVVNMVCFRVIGNDLTVTMAAEGGQLQLNVFEPVIAASIFGSQNLLLNGCRTLRERCVSGIVANEAACRSHVERSIGLATALNPVIGYERATELAAEALRTGRTIGELVREHGLLSEEALRRVLDPRRMTGSARPI